MTLPAVRFLLEALEELLGTQHWYGRREPALAKVFADAVAAAVERIRANSQSFPLIHGQIRRLVPKQFPMPSIFARRVMTSS